MRYLFGLAFVLLAHQSFSQISLDDFALGANAEKLNDLCIRLVPDVPYASGSAWYKKPIDLNAPFEMRVCLVLGDKDENGADGIVFVFHPRPRTGFRGEGMGFSGLIPSLGIEFDTYQNYHLGDPEDDHLAIMLNGRTYHSATSFQPISLTNLEDGAKHPMKITWDPATQKLEVYVDDELQTTYTGDLVNEVFDGNSVVYWGVTAATGRLSNVHDVCIKKLFFAEGVPPVENTERAERGQR